MTGTPEMSSSFPRTTHSSADGNTRQYAYDVAGRLTTQIELNAGSNPILTIVDAYDSVGNRTGRNQDGAITTWVYDSTNRLTSQLLSGARASFTYDSVGNILVKHQEGSNPITMAYDSANRIDTSQQGAVVTTYTSDANGNLTAQNAGGSKTTFSYDNENRLKTIQHPDSTIASYTYAGGFPVQGEGLRRSRHEPGANLTTTIWDDSDYLMEKGGGSTVRYVASEGEMLAEKRSGVRLAFVPDPLGSVIGLLNSNQAFTDTFAFWPYGEVRVRTGSTPTPFRWIGTLGYYHDLEWMYYIRARFELAVLGRWLTEDPLSLPIITTFRDSGSSPPGPPGFTAGTQLLLLSLDRLAYASCNPISAVDASGLAVTYPGCTPSQRQRLQRQLKDICGNRLASVSGGVALLACLTRRCNNAVITCRTSSDPNCRGACGYTYLPVPRLTVNICPSALNGSCGCLGRTILHELAHSCGHPAETVPQQCEWDAYGPGTPPCPH